MKLTYPQLLLLMVLASWSLSANALEFIVNHTLDAPESNPGDGVCSPVDALPGTCSLRAAIMEANANPGPHTIFLASGSYSLSRTGVGENQADTGDLDIHQDITIVNATQNPPSIWGMFADRIFEVHSGARLKLINIDIAGGQANVPGTTRGGAIEVNANATLELERVSVSSNIANIGGAIYSDGNVEIRDSLFYFNVLTDEHTLAEFANGAAILSRGTLRIERSTFRSNGVMPGDGGMFLPGRYAVHGRLGFAASPVTWIINSTFYDNTNGVFSDGVPMAVLNSTLVRNGFRGIRFLPDVNAGTDEQLVITNTVLYGHTGDCNGLPTDQPQYIVANHHNASSDETCGFTGDNDHQNISWPFQGDAGFHGGYTETFMPRPNGLLIDSQDATCFFNIHTDQRGEARPVDGKGDGFSFCDIGAVEYNPAFDPILEEAIFSDRFVKP